MAGKIAFVQARKFGFDNFGTALAIVTCDLLRRPVAIPRGSVLATETESDEIANDLT